MYFLTFNPNEPAIKDFNNALKIARERNEMIYPKWVDNEYKEGILTAGEYAVLRGTFYHYQDEEVSQLKSVKDKLGDKLFMKSVHSLIKRGYITIDEKGRLRYEMALIKKYEKQSK